MAELNWTDAQWQKVNEAVTETFGKANVASSFLPCYGPLTGGAETVRNERLTQASAAAPLRLDGDHDSANLKLVNLTVKVELSNEQVADEQMSNALLVFRRAANILAQETDRIVFQGYRRGEKDDDSKYVANSVDPQEGLAELPARYNSFSPLIHSVGGLSGSDVVLAVVGAVRRLEDKANSGPFACVLGNALFDRVHDSAGSLVLPADRITPLLKGGPLLRSGQIDDATGIVVALAGKAIDIVVGTPPTVQFLQRTSDAKFLFRVYERFVLRVRDQSAPPVTGFAIRPSLEVRVKQALAIEVAVAKAVAPRTREADIAKGRRKVAEAELAVARARLELEDKRKG